MMMDKSKTFMDRVEQEINAAKVGLNGPTVNIHIFSGLSGGTGAGCFLDVCYNYGTSYCRGNGKHFRLFLYA